MVIAKPILIARFTSAGDDISTLDKILFNDSTSPDFKDSNKIGAYYTKLEIFEPEGMGINQAAEKADGNVQALGVTEKTYILTGFITKTDGNDDSGSTNSFLILLGDWKKNASILKNVWEAGRFAIQDFNDSTNTLIPIGTGGDTLGLIFQNYTKTFEPVKNRTDFVITFRRSTGPDI